MRIQDVDWFTHLEDAQRAARARGVPIAVKALGQGTNHKDDW